MTAIRNIAIIAHVDHGKTAQQAEHRAEKTVHAPQTDCLDCTGQQGA